MFSHNLQEVRAFQRAEVESHTLPQSPQRVPQKRYFAVLPNFFALKLSDKALILPMM